MPLWSDHHRFIYPQSLLGGTDCLQITGYNIFCHRWLSSFIIFHLCISFGFRLCDKWWTCPSCCCDGHWLLSFDPQSTVICLPYSASAPTCNIFPAPHWPWFRPDFKFVEEDLPSLQWRDWGHNPTFYSDTRNMNRDLQPPSLSISIFILGVL